jgi:hypothetical protein
MKAAQIAVNKGHRIFPTDKSLQEVHGGLGRVE